jgi:ubiquinone/menaquinone biosynthesis C-methylase UbiE/uncharacterized protein YbaR (Trm112 family)
MLDLLALLRCPFCSCAIERATGPQREVNGALEYGVLVCVSCGFEYPVIAGIPIMMAAHETVDLKFETTALTVLDGPRVADLVEMLKQGAHEKAFASLMNPSELSGSLFPPLECHTEYGSRQAEAPAPATGSTAMRLKRAGARASRVAARRFGKLLLPRARARMASFLVDHEAEMSAVDVMDLYYRRYSGAENFFYFAFRFGQPRYLAALALALPLLQTEGPILDLACGAGHVTHFLSSAQSSRSVVGLDRDFFRMWLAKRYIAPEASYVCAPADRALPFETKSFGGVFCSDAFHLFLQRAASTREMQRLIKADGVIVLARFGNASVEPREGYELTARGYQDLFREIPHVLLGEDELIAAYRRRSGPDLSKRPISAEVERQKWLCIVASRREAFFAPAKEFERFPHAVGRLQLNPLYRIESRAENGDVSLRFEFPSDWYEFENKGYLEYAPETCVVSGAVMRALESQQSHPELDSLISQFVVIGMPARYRMP